MKIPILGNNIPKMGTSNTSLAEALFTQTQRRVLGLLFAHPEHSFYTNEIVRSAQSGIGSVQRELKRLEATGLVTVRKIGNQKHYQANRAAPIFEELHGIVIKTVGLADVLREAITPLDEQIALAFVFGSIARGKEHIDSDIDVKVVGDVSLEDAVRVLYPMNEVLRREINPVAMPEEMFISSLARGDRFVSRVVEEPKIYLKGGDDQLANLLAGPLT